jgi:hypothetical protein
MQGPCYSGKGTNVLQWILGHLTYYKRRFSIQDAKRYKCASMNFWSGDLIFPLSLTLPLPRKHIYRGSYPGNIYIEDQNLEKVQMCLNGILGQVTPRYISKNP